ncbi:hypothetical protein Fmac_027482 [Flemingia macrophylla]|uniref:Uncharacterized protein n=1 Tax=Flemingia macrophylla TaxID=520843 RepID=A0ABD1LID4_9FABA
MLNHHYKCTAEGTTLQECDEQYVAKVTTSSFSDSEQPHVSNAKTISHFIKILSDVYKLVDPHNALTFHVIDHSLASQRDDQSANSPKAELASASVEAEPSTAYSEAESSSALVMAERRIVSMIKYLPSVLWRRRRKSEKSTFKRFPSRGLPRLRMYPPRPCTFRVSLMRSPLTKDVPSSALHFQGFPPEVSLGLGCTLLGLSLSGFPS